MHRCLQHVKKDIRDAAKTKDEVTGKRRLRRDELLDPLLEWIQWSAFLPSDLEFHTFWSEIFQRMEANVVDTDFSEPLMAAYLKANIFDMSGTFI